ncbi:LuxR family two component transcriptional regulator [Paraburkholderia caballeronis]|uniref:response regulator transcription factor n=1 Tax=Paraburkholderia caballeronis TaxID=416943 RepID=UPI001064EDBA|nr:response regulator transcription factor [Paraburkholderia caballeronis]TDV37021.1 LuxR family two component transcriptional regulator [Paraburkholderia caballeronis]
MSGPLTPARIIVADDHPVVLYALERLIGRWPRLRVVGRATTFAELFDEAARVDFDVVITDLYMPCAGDLDAHDMLLDFRRRFAHASLIVLTGETAPAVLHRLLRMQVDGILSKKDCVDLIPDAIASAMARERYLGPLVRDLLARDWPAAGDDGRARQLSRREIEVIVHYASGLSVTEIAVRLGRSVKTISAQKCSAMKKLSLANDVELYRFAVESGIVSRMFG